MPFCFFAHKKEDNGVKVIDPMGEMLIVTWEGYASQLANAEQEDLVSVLKKIIEKEAINLSQEANVFVGKDTRYDIAYLLAVGISYSALWQRMHIT